MTAITLAPVRKSVRVKAAPAHAFEVFTARMGTWWPREMKIVTAPLKTVVVEPRAGGRWYERGEDGAEANLGKVLAWEPPHRVVMSWEINQHWRPDATVRAEVEVNFIADGPDLTIVEVEHRKLEVLGAEAGASVRERVDSGWPRVLEHFKAAVDA
ncbi:MAG TPA: SRPBCC family protein [Stellaceae bacterium]|nr:SRPBCC family protein [Stellaceae bacterium]